MNSFSFLRKRFRHYWQLYITLGLGVVLATALLATGPILVDTVIEFSLRRNFATAVPLASNIRLFNQAEPDWAIFNTETAQVDTFIQSRFEKQLTQIVPSGGSRYIHPWQNGQLIADQRVNLRFYGRSDAAFLDRVSFIEGSWPEANSFDNASALVVISESMAETYSLAVGDELPLSIRANEELPQYWLEISGIVRPLDPQDPFWFGEFSPLRPKSDARFALQSSAIIPQSTFFSLADQWFSPSDVSLEWYAQLNPSQIEMADLPQLQRWLDEFEEDNWDMKETGVRIDTDMHETLDAFEAQSTAVRAPLFALTATVVLLALYYVVMAASLTLQQVQREFAVLRGRGTSQGQIIRLQLLESSLISFVALMSGPGLAWLFVFGLAQFGSLADVRQADWVLRLPSAAWIAAFVGALACISNLLLPVPNMLKRTIVTHQSNLSRTEQTAWWQRYYLDVFILLIGLILLWRVRTNGSIIGGIAAQPRVDWLLLLAPVALLLGAATILLRVFPFILSLAARLASRGRGLPAALAMWQAARNPTHIARLVLLLTLAMAMGLFSTGLDRALDLNERDRAVYAAGSDLLLQNSSFNTAVSLPTISGINETSVAWRNSGSLTIRVNNANPRFDLLAIDPDSFLAITRYRQDFAEEPVPELMTQLAHEETAVPPTLPGTPSRIGLWLFVPSDLSPDFLYLLKIRTAQGEHITARLRPINGLPEPIEVDEGEPQPPQWAYYEAPLPSLADAHYPIHFHSLWVQSRHVGFWPSTPIGIDDITAVSANGESTVAEDFESPSSWFGATQEVVATFASEQPHAGDSYLLLTSPEFRPNRWYGISQMTPTALTQIDPLPALVSRPFADIAELEVGDSVSTWVDSVPTRFEIVGTVAHFPTLYNQEEAGFLITVHDPLITHVNSGRERSTTSNEVFISADPNVSEVTLAAALPNLYTGQTQIEAAELIRTQIKADPLALGLRSVTLFGYLVTAVLSLAGFGVHFYTTAKQREVIYGVLRALGLSPRQLYQLLLWEQCLLIFSGMALGTGLGLLLNQLTLPGLPINLGGRPPVPPFLVQTDWWAIGQIYLTLTVAFLLMLAYVVYLLRRQNLHRALRVGEE